MPPEMLAEFTTNVAADIEAMLPRFVGGFNRGDARAKEVTANPARPRRPAPARRHVWPPAWAGCATSTCARSRRWSGRRPCSSTARPTR
jgi:hypothetical protein